MAAQEPRSGALAERAEHAALRDNPAAPAARTAAASRPAVPRSHARTGPAIRNGKSKSKGAFAGPYGPVRAASQSPLPPKFAFAASVSDQTTVNAPPAKVPSWLPEKATVA